MSKTYRYNPDSFHKDARESNINKRKLEKIRKYAEAYGAEPRTIDRLLHSESGKLGEEIHEESGD